MHLRSKAGFPNFPPGDRECRSSFIGPKATAEGPQMDVRCPAPRFRNAFPKQFRNMQSTESKLHSRPFPIPQGFKLPWFVWGAFAALSLGCSKPGHDPSESQESAHSIGVSLPESITSEVAQPAPKPKQDKEAIANTEPPTSDSKHLVFGVYQTDKASVLYRKFLPVIEMVQTELSERMECEVEIELRIFKTYQDGLSALVSDQVDFVRFGPTSYVLAKRTNPSIELLAKESKNGQSTFQGVICVRADSPFQELQDLAGCRFAFGNQESTIGRYLSQAELLNVGIRAQDLRHFEYLAQHDMVGKAVLLGDFDAGALKENTFHKLNGDGALRKLHTFDNVTKPWVASAGLDPDLKEALRATLIGASDSDALGSLKVTGFMKAVDQDYQPVRSAMERVLAEFQPTGKATPEQSGVK